MNKTSVTCFTIFYHPIATVGTRFLRHTKIQGDLTKHDCIFVSDAWFHSRDQSNVISRIIKKNRMSHCRCRLGDISSPIRPDVIWITNILSSVEDGRWPILLHHRGWRSNKQMGCSIDTKCLKSRTYKTKLKRVLSGLWPIPASDTLNFVCCSHGSEIFPEWDA